MKYISIYQKEEYKYKHENVNGFQTATFKSATFTMIKNYGRHKA